MFNLIALRLVAISTDGWVAIIVGIVGPMFTTFAVLFYKSLQQLRREQKAEPVAVRTVAIDEMEALSRMWRETLRQKNADYEECHQQLESCQKRWWDHIRMCPLLGGNRDPR